MNNFHTFGFLIAVPSCVLILQNCCFIMANSATIKPQFLSKFLSGHGSVGNTETTNNGTKWAVLVAGSSGWWNYRHQADVCHAYQILKAGGLKDENIIVFMYDDIANYEGNPMPGVIINKPNGVDVYKGVPKDYTGENVTVNNLFGAILGNKSALTGGSGKVLDSGPDDYIFIYYTDHGGPGVIEMPDQPLYANDLIHVLKKKHEFNAYKSMVFYLEACESGSIFEGLLPSNISVYATTASNSTENSWAEYCPDSDAQTAFDTCLGDLYSVSWLEDCDAKDLSRESLQKQYVAVRNRTMVGTAFNGSSHVMQYGNKNLSSEFLSVYLGSTPPASGASSVEIDSLFPSVSVPQRDTDLFHFQHKVKRSTVGSKEYVDAQKKLRDEVVRREHVDLSINRIGNLLFGSENISEMSKVRPAGQPLVDDWDCLKTLVKTYEKYCGPLSTYGLKHMRHIANMCNAGVTTDQMVAISIKACS